MPTAAQSRNGRHAANGQREAAAEVSALDTLLAAMESATAEDLAKLREQKIRVERLADNLERRHLAGDSWCQALVVFSGEFKTNCPRCRREVSVAAAALSLELSCGCCWWAPNPNRGRDRTAWLHYERREGQCPNG